MANVRNGNTFYIDSVHASAADDLVVKNIRVSYIVISATAANAQCVLSDASTGDKKLDLRVATSFDSKEYWFPDNQIVFANGIKVATLTNAIVSLVVDESRG